eukprot:g10207.t1
MGVVWRVTDRQFDRPLAVKMMLPDIAANAEAAARFQREAELTGSLQHPAIPPVVDRGTSTDGAPYFSLKLVEGNTLDDLLRQRSSALDERPRWLGVFEQVCQAMGYAHSQRIIHRDLKPANVMVGAFGEVQLMDWGMAKRVGDSNREFSVVLQPDQPPVIDPDTDTIAYPVEPTPSANRESDTAPCGEDLTLTRAGQVLGTLAYMPPEQARGETDHLDARADVFALGGILCKILTDSAAYRADDRNRLFQRVLNAELEPAYAALDRCGADSELVSLCRRCLSKDAKDRPADAAEVAEEIRQYEEMTRQRLEQERTERAAAEAKAVEERKRRRVIAIAAALAITLLFGIGAAGWWYQKQQALEAARVAGQTAAEEARITHDSNDITFVLKRVPALRKNDQFVAAAALLKQAQSRLKAIAEPGELAMRVHRVEEELQIVWELDRIRLQKTTSAKTSFRSGFANGVDGAYARAFRDYGLDILNDDPAVVGAKIRKSAIAGELIDALDDWAIHEDKMLVPSILKVIQQADDSRIRNQLRDERVWKHAAERERRIRRLDFRNLPPSFAVSLAQNLKEIRQSGSAVTILKRLLANHPSDFWAHMVMGLIDDVPEHTTADRLGHYRAALAIRPQSAIALNNLGVGLMHLKRYEEAERALRTAIRFKPDLAMAYSNLGSLLQAQMRYKASEQEYRKAIKLDGSFAESHTNLGNLYSDMGRFPQAEQSYRTALNLNPRDPRIHYNLGNLFRILKRFPESEQAFRQAIHLDPGMAHAHGNLSGLLKDMGRFREAEESARKTISLEPGNVVAFQTLGIVLESQKRFAEAESAYRRALELSPRHKAITISLGILFQKTRRFREAELAYRSVIKNDPKHVTANFNLALVLLYLKRYREAESACRRAIAADPQFAPAYGVMSIALVNQGRFSEAIKTSESGLKRVPANIRRHGVLVHRN